MPKASTSRAERQATRLVASVLRKLRRARSHNAIVDAFIEIEVETKPLELDKLPYLLRMIRVWRNFDVLVDVYGIERFFFNWPDAFAAYAKEAAAWYRTVGATRAAEYLERACALFPKGNPPADDSEALDAVDRIQARRPTAFTDLDRKFRGATAELARRVRTYLLSHEAELRAALVGGETRAEQARSLPSVLAVKDPVEFLDAVSDMVRHAAGLASSPNWLTDEPNAANMLLVLRALYASARFEGIWKFLDSSDIGALAHDAERWCRAIGAKRAAAYLAGTAALFPRGRIPRDDIRRVEVVEALWEKGRGGRPDPLARLDRKYAGAVDQMVGALREHLRAHAEDPTGALEKLARARRRRQ
jgi:hypothetical protein